MKLLTKEIENRFKKIGSQEDLGPDAEVIVKFFTPDSNWTWYALEYNEESRTFFGIVEGFEVEYGYFSLNELENITGPMGLPIERDMYFGKKRVKDISFSSGKQWF